MSAWRWLPLLLAIGCVPGRMQRVPPETLAQIPFAGRVELLDAEDELALAQQRLVQSIRAEAALDAELLGAESHLDAAQAAASGQDGSPELLGLSLNEARARHAYLTAAFEAEERNRSAAEVRLTCAEARLELARMKVARKVGIEGADQLPQEAMEEQVDTCTAELQDREANARARHAHARTARASWDERKQALDSAAQGAEATPFIR